MKESQDRLARKLDEMLDGAVITEVLRQQLLPYAFCDSLVVVRPDVAVVHRLRSGWGTSGGIGYHDQVRVFVGSQADVKEWQIRDRHCSSRDRLDLQVHSIGVVEVSEKDEKVIVEVELVNIFHGNRNITFIFDSPSEQATVKMLSESEQEAFVSQAEKEVERVMAHLREMWERKPEMPPSGPGAGMNYVPYRQPSIKQTEFRPDLGVAAFVAEEQIDHRVGDPQIRHELYVLTAGSSEAKHMAEDHGYGRNGGAFLTILEVESERITIDTKRGKRVIALS